MTKILPWRKGMMIGAAAVLLLLMAVPMASAGWSSYKTITIDGSKVQGTVSDFPVLISITGDTNLSDGAQDDGDDILFTDGNNSVKLDHEIEEFKKSNGKLVAWVRVPSLTAGTNYAMRMWYGNPSCGPQENPEGVWDSNYVMVQHLEETEDMTHYDSTTNNNDGTVGADPQVNQDATGKIDGADDFKGEGSSYVQVPDATSLDLTGSYTLEAWAKFDTFPNVTKAVGLLVCKRESPGDKGYCYGVTNAKEIRMGVENSFYTTSGLSLSTGTWYHIVSVFNDTSNAVKIYVNGGEKKSDTYTGTLSATNEVLRIGACSYSTTPCARQADGIIDEVRISKTARSADWIKTSYNNQNNPGVGGFLSGIGPEISPAPEQPVPELPTIFLFSVGLLALAGYLYVRTRS